MKFLMMIKHAELAQPFQPPQSLNDAMGAFVTEGFTKGWLKDTAGLKPTAEGQRIRQKGGKLTFVDGPFTEAKEIVGGFFLLDGVTWEEAIAIAGECPAAEWATVEVRAVGPCWDGAPEA